VLSVNVNYVYWLFLEVCLLVGFCILSLITQNHNLLDGLTFTTLKQEITACECDSKDLKLSYFVMSGCYEFIRHQIDHVSKYRSATMLEVYLTLLDTEFDYVKSILRKND
jgi:hypothetical protein